MAKSPLINEFYVEALVNNLEESLDRPSFAAVSMLFQLMRKLETDNIILHEGWDTWLRGFSERYCASGAYIAFVTDSICKTDGRLRELLTANLCRCDSRDRWFTLESNQKGTFRKDVNATIEAISKLVLDTREVSLSSLIQAVNNLEIENYPPEISNSQ